MLPDNLKDNAVAAAVEAFDTDAVTGGKLELGELTLEVAAAKMRAALWLGISFSVLGQCWMYPRQKSAPSRPRL